MQEINEKIVVALKSRALPDDFRDIIGGLYDEKKNSFDVQESTYWDYKRQFPFSMSDDYFGGVVRIICAFYNTYGGILIFGVHDASRDPGHNPVRINIERLNSVLREKLSSPIEVLHKRYFLSEDDEKKVVDLLLIPKRSMGVPPARQVVDIGRYQAGKIWLRIHHEVVEARYNDFGFLYSSRDSYGIEDEDFSSRIPNSLPPSPATLKDFIGRRDVMDQLYRWLFADDEPRIFLYGKGGSGKSTIAYEFAKLISEGGGSTPTKVRRPIDFVLFLGAKRRALDPIRGTIIQQSSYDFTNANELFRAVLELTEWMTLDDVAKLANGDLIKELQGLFETAQILLVIDDIDTLTTEHIDPGMDILYRLLSRSKGGGKVLYTLRNAPSQSLKNAIEVPGLDLSVEYPEFVETCARQFRVSPPSSDVLLGEVAKVSERRPLAIEVIVGYRRTCSTYEQALQLFRGKSGDEARRYLFQREYDALSSDNKSRLFLAALALFGRPVRFSELKSVLQFSDEQLRDCVSETLEMFLQVEKSNQDETIYSLGGATEIFIRSISRDLAHFETLKANVKYFKSPFLPKNADVAQIKFRVNGFLASNDLTGAYDFLRSRNFPPAVTQHPEYNMALGRVCAGFKPPKYEEARGAFKFAVEHGFADVQGMRDWFWMEQNSQFNVSRAIEVCDYVMNGKQFSMEAKAEFHSKRGMTCFDMARNSFTGDPEISFKWQRDSINCFLRSLSLCGELKLNPEKTKDKLFNAIRYFLISVNRMSSANREDLYLQLLDFLSDHASSRKHPFDFAVLAFVQFCGVLGNSSGTDLKNRNRVLLQRLLPLFERNKGVLFNDEEARNHVLFAIKEGISRLKS